ncbi:hypothetical protein WS62_24285 [Burkholderia sp. ABCPW 14]|uniref:hypothetical protein n=1 Tax=Burkholderia sp. ABCPW 14 TaxID=1637860 RepID=UPI000770C9DB|nr:hypothetical protein [Burkholderia sp. ABCPW 14]KVD81703.1 hypothetical protein WS62_24285 [Burkholderia sp. ABCPW 14]
MADVITPQDIALATAIEAAADGLDFNNDCYSFERLETFSVFIVQLIGQLYKEFPIAAAALEQIDECKATLGNPVTRWKQTP